MNFIPFDLMKTDDLNKAELLAMELHGRFQNDVQRENIDKAGSVY